VKDGERLELLQVEPSEVSLDAPKLETLPAIYGCRMVHSGRHEKSHATAARRHTLTMHHSLFKKQHPNRTSTCCKMLRWALDYTF